MVRIEVDMLAQNAPSVLALRLFEIQAGDSAEIVLQNAEYCPNRIVPIIGVADYYRERGVGISLQANAGDSGLALLKAFNQNKMSALNVSESPFGRVWRFDNAKEQTELVTAMVRELEQSTNLAKGVKQCFEWCLNEVTDNVLNHSQPNGNARGYVMAQFVASSKRLKICVFDAGIGLRESLRDTSYNPSSSEDAIQLCVRRGVTNGKGQGNGLWGLHEMVKISVQGKLHIRSDGAEYLFVPKEGVESTRATWSLKGLGGSTTVDFQMDCSVPTSLQDIFGEDYVSVDLWQEAREDENGNIRILVSELADGYGSRESASKVRFLVENAIENDGKFVVLDFDGVNTCSSSFIDELVGKLVAKYGSATYTNFTRFENMRGLAAGLANIAIAQRLKVRQGLAPESGEERGNDDKTGLVTRIVTCMRENSRISLIELAQRTGRTMAVTRGVVDKLREFGIVMREGARKNGHWRIADWVNDDVLAVEDKELQPVQISPTGNVMVRLEVDFSKDLETLRLLEKMSEEMGKPIEEVIRIALERELERYGDLKSDCGS